MRIDTTVLVRRVLPRVIIALILVILALFQVGVFQKLPPAWALDSTDDTIPCGVPIQDDRRFVIPCPPSKPYDEPPPSVECGPDPYLYNEIGGHWQRRFNMWCFDATETATRDPLEIICDGLTYPECQEQLATIGLDGLSWQETIDGLVDLGYWSYSCSCVPDGAPTLP